MTILLSFTHPPVVPNPSFFVDGMDKKIYWKLFQLFCPYNGVKNIFSLAVKMYLTVFDFPLTFQGSYLKAS